MDRRTLKRRAWQEWTAVFSLLLAAELAFFVFVVMTGNRPVQVVAGCLCIGTGLTLWAHVRRRP